MSIRLCLSVLTATSIVVLGCGQNAQPVGPSLTPSVVARSDTAPTGATGSLAALVSDVEHAVTLFDACDPETFNAALGAGTCLRPGGMRFENFLDELRQHHSVGAWPLLIDDTTTVRRSERPELLELTVRAWPSGEGVVRITCRADGADTEVTMEEDATKGPAVLVPKPVRDVVLDRRNREALRRLAILVERAQPDPA